MKVIKNNQTGLYFKVNGHAVEWVSKEQATTFANEAACFQCLHLKLRQIRKQLQLEDLQ